MKKTINLKHVDESAQPTGSKMMQVFQSQGLSTCAKFNSDYDCCWQSWFYSKRDDLLEILLNYTRRF